MIIIYKVQRKKYDYIYKEHSVVSNLTLSEAVNFCPDKKINDMMAEKSKILVIGGTGYIGKFIVEASAKAGHPTFALVRETTKSNPDKAKLINSFKSSGVTLVQVNMLAKMNNLKFLCNAN